MRGGLVHFHIFIGNIHLDILSQQTAHQCVGSANVVIRHNHVGAVSKFSFRGNVVLTTLPVILVHGFTVFIQRLEVGKGGYKLMMHRFDIGLHRAFRSAHAVFRHTRLLVKNVHGAAIFRVV